MRRPSDLALHLLREVRIADEEEGGLVVGQGYGDDAYGDDYGDDQGSARDEHELAALAELVDLGLVEHRRRYGEAPDGEEDERDADTGGYYRITPRGVDLLRDLGMTRR